jgi:hypothetical protein
MLQRPAQFLTGIRNAKKFFAGIYSFVGRISDPNRDSSTG